MEISEKGDAPSRRSAVSRIACSLASPLRWELVLRLRGAVVTMVTLRGPAA